jgi:hypothetical protein
VGAGAKSVVVAAGASAVLGPASLSVGKAAVTEDDGGDWRRICGAGCGCACGAGVADTMRVWRGAGAVVRGAEAALVSVVAGAEAGWSAAGAAGFSAGAGFFGAGWVAAGWSAAWVIVPLRLKFSSALGPTVLAGGGVSWAGAGASCAGATVGASASAPAKYAYLKRETAFICSRRSRVDSRQNPVARQAHAHRLPHFQAQVR